jgi:ubiquinone/menaquinone biosynthesis C-methylase UbiE
MHWETKNHDLTGHIAQIPGGTAIVDALIESLSIGPGQKLLDLNPGNGAVAAAIASEHDVNITALSSDAREEALSESIASSMHLKDRITVVPGSIAAIPLPSEQFNRVYGVASMFPIPSIPGVIAELHRMVAPDGFLGFAGPASINNQTPPYMVPALRDYQGVTFRTPAWTAIAFAQYGFHIMKAEFIHGSYDHWKEWLDKALHVPEDFRRAVIEDAGRWLMLGIIVLRKPPKPRWAV